MALSNMKVINAEIQTATVETVAQMRDLEPLAFERAGL